MQKTLDIFESTYNIESNSISKSSGRVRYQGERGDEADHVQALAPGYKIGGRNVLYLKSLEGLQELSEHLLQELPLRF
jgi:hypothetical protein